MSNFEIIEFITLLAQEFEKNTNADVALKQKQYVRNKFEYYGLTTTKRRVIQQPFLNKAFLPPKDELARLTKLFWEKPQRDFQYFSQELVYKYVKQFQKKDIELFEYMVTHKPWWETVDFIATKLMGAYFKIYPEQRMFYIKKWLLSNHIWLQRSALLFQLKYKEELDTKLLSLCIQHLLDSNEFFINKAIGWVLREYSKTNPKWVIDFTHKTALSPLSKREALRIIQ
tara:strand:- start:50188 stop:50871 length:684 start_codon:yes stop_codon:yes gene_type:complete